MVADLVSVDHLFLYHIAMKRYIDRLIACGYSEEKATELCIEVSNNLPLIELENLILSLEKKHVG